MAAALERDFILLVGSENLQTLNKSMLLVTYIKLVPRGSVGLQVVIRRSAAEATSQFVMLALNQVFL